MPVPQTLNEIVEVGKAIKIVPQESITGKICEQIVDAPVSHSQPQILKEVVEVVKAVKKVPQERISGRIREQIDDDLVPPRVDMDLDDFVTMLTNSGIPVSSH